MKLPKTDNCCTELGWKEYEINTGGHCLHVSAPPKSDFDGVFTAFCHDEQEIITIHGWLIDDYWEIEDE